mmetsp:Transcript_76794/g.217306  ORF Transcript_76794/g.217306 Transcript_76794/m.217306 type:complete len:101 (-) Transcript_76794:195-497(-)
MGCGNAGDANGSAASGGKSAALAGPSGGELEAIVATSSAETAGCAGGAGGKDPWTQLLSAQMPADVSPQAARPISSRPQAPPWNNAQSTSVAPSPRPLHS